MLSITPTAVRRSHRRRGRPRCTEPGRPRRRARAAAHPAEPEPLVVKVDDGGFHWGDAGIGAAAGFGAALVLAGGLALAGRRDRVAAHTSNKEERR